MDKKQKQKRDTPITDGDARPDMPLNPDENEGTKAGRPRKKFEKERMSDVNSLEDFKDAELNPDGDKS